MNVPDKKMYFPNITEFQISIPKEQLAKLPMRVYDGKTILIDRLDQVEEAVAVLRSTGIIGFDTETKPTFKKGQHNRVALLQLSNHSCCYLFRLCKIGLPTALKDFLEDESVQKIGLSIHDDFHNLRAISPSLNPAGFIDLQPFVKKYLIADNSLARIYGIIFGRRISKSQQLTNWEAQELKPAQLSYASLDALACLDIYDCLTSGSFHPEESPYLKKVLPQENDIQLP